MAVLFGLMILGSSFDFVAIKVVGEWFRAFITGLLISGTKSISLYPFVV